MVRLADTKPGEVAEMDFGCLGLMGDPESGQRRMVWALVIVLGYSRHSFVWPLMRQQMGDVIDGLEAARACFGGYPPGSHSPVGQGSTLNSRPLRAQG